MRSVAPQLVQRRPDTHHEPRDLSVAKSKRSRRKRRRSRSPAASKRYESIGYINDEVALRSKPNQSDYVTGTKNLIAKAIDIYMVNIYTVDMFPDSLIALGWASNSWKQSCRAAGGRNFDSKDSERIYRLVSSHGRSSIKPAGNMTCGSWVPAPQVCQGCRSYIC
ncbi:hypothetical protein BC629DRAFT_1500107 [Irpex lacteus]|nr:hypothetical protein BC629DRAFT_1500107 [Irpex lacteus]